jgi:hypothetical protein
MKKTLFSIAVVSAIFFISACSKDLPASSSYPIEGLWIGTFDVKAGSTPADSLYLSFYLRADSTMQTQGLGADGNTYYATGSWSLNGSSFTATFATTNLSQAGVVQQATGIYNGTDGTLSGDIQTVGGSYRSTFSLTRIK